jgi:hypothetical protein
MNISFLKILYLSQCESHYVIPKISNYSLARCMTNVLNIPNYFDESISESFCRIHSKNYKSEKVLDDGLPPKNVEKSDLWALLLFEVE